MEKRKIKRRLTISGLAIALVLVLSLVTLGSCQISYLTQAVAGHLRIMSSRQSIDKILKKRSMDEESREKLELVVEIHQYAIRELGLPDNKSYTVISEIKDDYPGWNVFCAPKFSIEPKTWCFPIAGCVVYHGYFKKEKAQEFAEKMKNEGYDVYVSPFTAYSTLGWFNDPILSTHLKYDSVRLAGLIIHELAHQRFYKSGDSDFSEAFAVTVERAGVLHWLESLNREDQVDQAKKEWVREDLFVDRMLLARNELKELYQSTQDTSILAAQKDALLRQLEKDLNLPKNRLNNASLIPISTYHTKVPMFQELLDSCNRDFRVFYKKVEELQ